MEYVARFGQPNAPIPAACVACVPSLYHPPDATEGQLAPFHITPAAILESIREGLGAPIEPEPEVVVPKTLISEEQMRELKAKTSPGFVGFEDGLERHYDEGSGVVQRKLSNGIKVNIKVA